GEVQVLAWDSPQVKIAAEIDVGAETIEAAQVLAESIEVKVNSGEDVFEVRTVYPTPQGQGKPKMEVNLVVTVPRESSVMVKNHLGDTIIAGVNGGVAVESRLGAVLLQNIGGEVK